MASDEGEIVSRDTFESMQEKASLAILHAMQHSVFTDRIELQEALGKVKRALRRLEDCTSNAEINRVVGSLYRELPTTEYVPTSPNYSPYSPLAHLQLVCNHVEIILVNRVLIKSNLTIVCSQLGAGSSDEAESPPAPTPAMVPRQRPTALAAPIRDTRVVGLPLYENQEPELGAAAPSVPAPGRGTNTAELRRVYAVSEEVRPPDRPRAAGSSRSSVQESLDIDRVGERTSDAESSTRIQVRTLCSP